MNRRVAAGAALVCVAARAAAALPEEFDVKPLSDAGAAAEIGACIGAKTTRPTIDAFLRAAGADPSSMQLVNREGPGAAIAQRGQWSCVRFSEAGFPMWPVEALTELITPRGVPADVVAHWHRQLLEQVVDRGTGRGLLVFPRGTAFEVVVYAAPRQAAVIKYTTRFLRPGEYRAADYPAVLADAGFSSLSTSSTSGDGMPSRAAIPPRRLLKPHLDGFIAVPGTAETGHFVFAGTRWKMSGGGDVWLQPDGLVLVANATSSENGTWQVSDGSLRVALVDGRRYTMVLRDDRVSMLGEAWRPAERRNDVNEPEHQWSFTMELR